MVRLELEEITFLIGNMKDYFGSTERKYTSGKVALNKLKGVVRLAFGHYAEEINSYTVNYNYNGRFMRAVYIVSMDVYPTFNGMYQSRDNLIRKAYILFYLEDDGAFGIECITEYQAKHLSKDKPFVNDLPRNWDNNFVFIDIERW